MAQTKAEKLEAKAIRQYEKEHPSHIKLSTGDKIFNVINYTVFGLITLICFFPFYYLFIQTISSRGAVAAGQVTLFPIGITLDNYKLMFQANDLFQAMLVTVGRTIIGTALMVLATGFIGYLCTKEEMWHRKLWYRFMTITMYFNAGIIPWYLNMSMLGLTNNFMAYIIPGIVAPYNIILVKTYIESIPAELEESAFIDGASHLRVFWSIIWPLSKPILATITIFGAVGHWNSFTDSLILMSDEKLYTLQHRLQIYLQEANNLEDSLASGMNAKDVIENALNAKVLNYTVSMTALIPILCVYPFLMRYFEKGIMLGAVKG